MQKIYDGVRVIEIAGINAAFCGKMLASYGAEVIKAEPPKGHPSRQKGPFAKGVPAPENSLSFAYFNTGKKSVVIDLDSEEGIDTFKKLCATADIFIEDNAPGFLKSKGLSYDELSRINPGLIMCSVTPFGQSGPHAGWISASDIIVDAMGGSSAEIGFVGRGPLHIGYDIQSLGASQYALAAVQGAYHNRLTTGKGTFIEVSQQEALIGWRSQKPGNAQASRVNRPWFDSAYIPQGVVTCKDGFANVMLGGKWDPQLDWFDDKGIDTSVLRSEKYDYLRDILGDWDQYVLDKYNELGAMYTATEFMEEAQARKIPCCVVESPDTLLKNKQLVFRKYFTEIEHKAIGKAKYPAYQVMLTESPALMDKPAPLLGEHTKEILEALNGNCSGKNGETIPAANQGQALSSEVPAARRPLEDITVLDFSWVIAGPLATQLLRAMGARVIKVESKKSYDILRSNGLRYPEQDYFKEGGYHFQMSNWGKENISINLKSEKGRRALEELVKRADLVVSNFGTGAFKKLGLTYDDLVKINPDIIVCNSSGMGFTGPYSRYIAFAPNLQAESGISGLIGYEGDAAPFDDYPPLSDYLGGVATANALLAAVEYKRKTGKGQFIDLSQLEAVACLLGAVSLDNQINGTRHDLIGNRHYAGDMAPHGFFPCSEPETYCAIAADSDEMWRKLALLIDADERTFADERSQESSRLSENPRFSNLEGRLENIRELDELISAWTKKHTKCEVAEILQKAGVSAAPLQKQLDCFFGDEHLNARHFFHVQKHKPFGDAISQWRIPGFAFRFDEMDKTDELPPAHAIGEDTGKILTDYLGFDRQWVTDGIADGSFE